MWTNLKTEADKTLAETVKEHEVVKKFFYDLRKYILPTKLLLARLMDQYCFACRRLSLLSSVGVCNTPRPGDKVMPPPI